MQDNELLNTTVIKSLIFFSSKPRKIYLVQQGIIMKLRLLGIVILNATIVKPMIFFSSNPGKNIRKNCLVEQDIIMKLRLQDN